MAGITSYINININETNINSNKEEEEGRRIKVRVKGMDDLKVRVRVKVRVDREEKGKGKERTDRLISSTTPLEPSLMTSTLSKEEARTKSLKLKADTTTKKKNPLEKRMMKRRTKNRVSSAPRRSNITLEVFVDTRLVSE